jgi:hypothetical protein
MMAERLTAILPAMTLPKPLRPHASTASPV